MIDVGAERLPRQASIKGAHHRFYPSIERRRRQTIFPKLSGCFFVGFFFRHWSRKESITAHIADKTSSVTVHFGNTLQHYITHSIDNIEFSGVNRSWITSMQTSVDRLIIVIKHFPVCSKRLFLLILGHWRHFFFCISIFLKQNNMLLFCESTFKYLNIDQPIDRSRQHMSKFMNNEGHEQKNEQEQKEINTSRK